MTNRRPLLLASGKTFEKDFRERPLDGVSGAASRESEIWQWKEKRSLPVLPDMIYMGNGIRCQIRFKTSQKFPVFPCQERLRFFGTPSPDSSSALTTHCPFSSRSLSRPGLFASGASDRLLAGFWQTPLLHVFFPAVHGEQKRRRPQGSSRIFREQASGTCALQKKGAGVRECALPLCPAQNVVEQ